MGTPTHSARSKSLSDGSKTLAYAAAAVMASGNGGIQTTSELCRLICLGSMEFDAEPNSESDDDEDGELATTAVAADEDGLDATKKPSSNAIVARTLDELKAMSIHDLRAECEAQGLDSSWCIEKSELAYPLFQHAFGLRHSSHAHGYAPHRRSCSARRFRERGPERRRGRGWRS